MAFKILIAHREEEMRSRIQLIKAVAMVILFIAGFFSAVTMCLGTISIIVTADPPGEVARAVLNWWFILIPLSPFTVLYKTAPVKKFINEIAELPFRL